MRRVETDDGHLRALRAELLRSFGDALSRGADEVVSRLISIETPQTAAIEVEKSVRALRTYDRELPLLEGRRPLGDVYVSLPYNTPLYSLVLYAAGAALPGNRVLVRPSAATAGVLQLIVDAYGESLREVGVSLYGGSGAKFVSAGLSEGLADAFLFTGSWNSLERLLPLRQSHQRLIYSGSGMNPFIVLADADLDAALESAIYTRLFNSGQDCLAPEVFFVERAVLEEFISDLTCRLESLSIGPLGRAECDVGPLVSREVADRARALLRSAHAGRHVLYETPLPPGVDAQTTVPPLVLLTDSRDPIVNVEKFAPIFVLVPFDDIDEVRRWVDDSLYGLCLTQFGGAEAADWPVPHVLFNACAMKVEEADAHVPFGGRGRSGFVLGPDGKKDGPVLFSVETSIAL